MTREIYLYLCDSEKAIADGKCDGISCRDVESSICCHHTADLTYAKYKKPFKKRIFDKCYLVDEDGVSEVLSYWEVDPRDLS